MRTRLVLVTVFGLMSTTLAGPGQAADKLGFWSDIPGGTEVACVGYVPARNGRLQDFWGGASNFYYMITGGSNTSIQSGVSELLRFGVNSWEIWYAVSNSFNGDAEYNFITTAWMPSDINQEFIIHTYRTDTAGNWGTRILYHGQEIARRDNISAGFYQASSAGMYISSEYNCTTSNYDGTYYWMERLGYRPLSGGNMLGVPHSYEDRTKLYQTNDHTAGVSGSIIRNDPNVDLGRIKMFLRTRQP